MKSEHSETRAMRIFVFLVLFLPVVLTQCIVGGETPCQSTVDCPAAAPVCEAQKCVACRKDSDCPPERVCVVVGRRAQCAVKSPPNERVASPDTATPEPRSDVPSPKDDAPKETPVDGPKEQAKEPPPKADGEPTPKDQGEATSESNGEPGDTDGEPPPEDGGDASEPLPEPPPACLEGEVRECYTGPAKTKGVGECVPGGQSCVGGVWGPCVGDVKPTAETCDGKDNDCDGKIDNGNPGGGKGCDTGKKGICLIGTLTCKDAKVSCIANEAPTTEVCDGKDNDCDGTVDNVADNGKVCSTTGKGECKPGTMKCVSNKLTCVANKKATAEICDGKDNDCDGTTDEGNPGGGAACSTTNKGECKPGKRTCSAGKIICKQNVQPKAEVCDGKDNDCDGTTDEGNPGSGKVCHTYDGLYCWPGTTACTGGKTVCNKGSQVKLCQATSECSVCGTGSTCVVVFQNIKACRNPNP